jgi:hypothetical protein
MFDEYFRLKRRRRADRVRRAPLWRIAMWMFAFSKNSFGDEDKISVMMKLLKLIYKYELYIEPNVFEVSESG